MTTETKTITTEQVLARMKEVWVDAHHTSGGCLTQAECRRLGCEDPAEAWEGVGGGDASVADLEAMAFEAETHTADAPADAIDVAISRWAESRFRDWASAQPWFGRVRRSAIDDVCCGLHVL